MLLAIFKRWVVTLAWLNSEILVQKIQLVADLQYFQPREVVRRLRRLSGFGCACVVEISKRWRNCQHKTHWAYQK